MSYYPEHANIAWNLANKRLESKPPPSKHREYEGALFQARRDLSSIIKMLNKHASYSELIREIGEASARIDGALADRIASQRKPQK